MKIEDKTIIAQVFNNLNFLGKFVLANERNTKQTISDFFAKWQESRGFNQGQNYSLLNQGVVLTSLYGLLVYPTEIYFDNIPRTKIEELSNGWKIPDKFTWGSSVTDNCKHLQKFAKRLRNSISHGRLKINGDYFVFTDFVTDRNKNKTENIEFEVKFVVKDLFDFIHAFAEASVKDWKIKND